jgi:hypothetical protein
MNTSEYAWHKNISCRRCAEFQWIGSDCRGPVSLDRLFGFLSEKIIQFVVVEAVEM